MNEALSVACTNDECPEFRVPKVNLAGVPAEAIHCGTCGGPVENVESEPPPDAT